MDNYYNDDVKLGLAIGKLKEENYYYREIVKFIKGEDTSPYSYFGKLKPLFDKFGYEKTMSVLLAVIAEDGQKEQDAKDAEEERKENIN